MFSVQIWDTIYYSIIINSNLRRFWRKKIYTSEKLYFRNVTSPTKEFLLKKGPRKSLGPLTAAYFRAMDKLFFLRTSINPRIGGIVSVYFLNPAKQNLKTRPTTARFYPRICIIEWRRRIFKISAAAPDKYFHKSVIGDCRSGTGSE